MAAHTPMINVGRRRKHFDHETPSVMDFAYSAIATSATTSTKTAGVTAQAMRPTVPIRQKVKARRSYFSGGDSGGRMYDCGPTWRADPPGPPRADVVALMPGPPAGDRRAARARGREPCPPTCGVA